MDPGFRASSRHLSPSSSPARPPVSDTQVASYRASPYPQHYVPFQEDSFNEKVFIDETPLEDVTLDRKRPSASPIRGGPSHREHAYRLAGTPDHAQFSHSSRPLTPSSTAPGAANYSHCRPYQPYTRPRGLRIANLIKPWIPIIMYSITTLGFLVAIAFWRDQVFTGLDELSDWLKEDVHFGYAVLSLLIFVTTIPPFPLYSTLITLSGYTFGPWTGAIISYISALTGAIAVFVLSRTLLRDTISRWLSSVVTIKRVVRAIEKQPKLLFLIRLAPYPYNVMNCLLAASPTLSFRTYTTCTALSLFKVIIHTSVGASIHSFKDYHSSDGEADEGAGTLSRVSTVVGIVLCVAIFVYLSYVARKAVDEEMEGDEVLPTHITEEARVFLSLEDGGNSGSSVLSPMAESPFRTPEFASGRGRPG